MWNGDDGEKGGGRQCGVGGGGSGDVLAKVTAGNAVYVRRSKVACHVAELSLSLCVCLPSPSSLAHTLPSFSCPLGYHATPCSSSSVCASSLSLFSLRSLSPSLSVSLPLSGCAARCGAARQTARMHQMHRTDRCPSVPVLPLPLVYFGRSPLPLPVLPPSRRPPAVPIFLSLSFSRSLRSSPSRFFITFFLRSTTPPPRVTLTSFTSFCRRRRRTATPGNSPLLYQRVMLLAHVLAVGSYVCTSEHTVR